jgi:hypothetical protein
MSELPDDAPFDAVRGDDDASDPDTTLILEYLSNKLGPADAQRLEDRARTDKEFRCKLADIVLLKGLVMLALEKNPGPQTGQCRRTRGLFLDYLKGRTSAKKTALLARHLEECFECELAFEKFQCQTPSETEASGGGFLSFFGGFKRTRGVVYTAVVAVAIAAGAFGVVGILSSGASKHRAGAASIAGPEHIDGLFARPGEVRAAVDAVAASAPADLDSGRLSETVDRVLAGGISVKERGDVYEQLGKEFRKHGEPVFWALAAGESSSDNRSLLYGALTSAPIQDERSLVDAARRELEKRSLSAIGLLLYANDNPTPAMRRLLEDAFVLHRQRDQLWSQIMQLYPRMTDSPAVERHMAEVLADPDDWVRSHGAVARANAKKSDALPIGLALLGSRDEAVQANAAHVIARLGSQQDIDRLVAQPWATRCKPNIVAQLKKRPAGLPTVTLPPEF